jgi:deoxyribodipyrimidine photo-lyase
MSKSKHVLFWFRRDLRLHDNGGLQEALKASPSVVPVFIFDSHILSKLNTQKDFRVQFIYEQLQSLKIQLQELGSDLWVFHGEPLKVLKEIHKEMDFNAIYTNHDYEPYPRRRDREVKEWCDTEGVSFFTFKDQVIFEKSEILTDQKKPYTVYTPYKKKWLAQFSALSKNKLSDSLFEHFKKTNKKISLISPQDLGFVFQEFQFPKLEILEKNIKKYEDTRNFPYLEKGTSKLGVHLRFGTVSIRDLAGVAKNTSDVWLSELIWREFFMQILWHYPDVVKASFRPAYDKVKWRKSEEDFKKWSSGQTGYPLVDAGMRELNTTGYMHNRVRMVVASFLTKHLLIHWYQGERYFASRLLDYDLSANNGNWQWAAGTGCDAAPYFRIFNPESQIEKFDPNFEYVKKWVPEFGTNKYVSPMVEHKLARERCLSAFKEALKGDPQ